MSEMHHKHHRPMVYVDTVAAIALLPYLAFLARREPLRVADLVEFSVLVLIEIRMMAAAMANFPLTHFEKSGNAFVIYAAIFVALNLLARYVPAMRKRL